MGKYYYAAMWLIIGIISSIDIYWAITNQDMMMELEENPVGRYLIEKDDGSIALFMCVKVAGTVIALGSLVILYHWKKKYAWPIIIALTIAQFWLLHYLSGVDNSQAELEREKLKWQHTSINVQPVSTSSPKNYP